MRRAVRLLVLGVLVAAGTAYADNVPQPPPEGLWKEFSSQDGRFSVLLPGSPKQTSENMVTHFGVVEAKMFILRGPEQSFYAVAYMDYPRDALAKHTTDELLDRARDASVKKVKGKLAGEAKITLGGNPGREVKIEAPTKSGGQSVTMRLVFAKERLYQAIVVFPKGKEDAGEEKRFFESFKLEADK
jgi:hypothetical protein